MLFLPAERFFAIIIGALATVDLSLIIANNVAVDWAGYALPTLGALSLIAAGQYYRIFRDEERLALALGASGLFILFTLVASVFNYLLLPISSSPIDLTLAKFDAVLGYQWPDAVALAARWPLLGQALSFVYFSSLPQLAFVVLVLGFAGNTTQLWHFLLTGVLGVLGCIAVWSVFPTFGPSTLYDISPDLAFSIRLGVTSDYGRELLRLAHEGPGYISPKNVLGLIGFPSFHTVMACMSVVFLSRIRWIFPFALMLNIAMVPAILVHGGHHLSDVLGGVLMFAVAYLLAGKLLARLSASSNQEASINDPVASLKVTDA